MLNFLLVKFLIFIFIYTFSVNLSFLKKEKNFKEIRREIFLFLSNEWLYSLCMGYFYYLIKFFKHFYLFWMNAFFIPPNSIYINLNCY